MKLPTGPCAIVVLLLSSGVVLAQTRQQPRQPSTPGYGQPADPSQRPGPNQPIVPRTLPPLTKQQQEYVDRVLDAWEQSSSKVKTFECRFVRWEYDKVFGYSKKVDGVIKYKAPDKGMLRVLEMEQKSREKEQKGKMVKVDAQNSEHWICDGKSIFEYNYIKKQLLEHKLPPEMQGKAISSGPLPFLFGAKAAALKKRYFIRAVPPPQGTENQIWLEAYPRTREDAANFTRAELILTASNMQPFALQMHDPNGKTQRAYSFYEIKINNPLDFLQVDPFHASTPFGWQKVVQPAPTIQAERPGSPTDRRPLR
ncbi:MAG: TIGR03009 domain-containing protein [Thermoguttaceae bacterium]